ncbi:MAG: 2-amino-4-hydroxy-6-hydroxymethyldihydropteridine diphosphokinase [Dehalococcoidia bacterium]
MTDVLLAIGSNLGDRLGNLQRAVELLRDEGVAVVTVSSVWETAPVPADQPAFLNAALTATTSLGPYDVLAALKRIERALGRRPERRWGPRPVDLDILYFGDITSGAADLTIPHPRIGERAFVLAPLAEVAPPVLLPRALEQLVVVGLAGVRRTGLPLRLPGG